MGLGPTGDLGRAQRPGPKSQGPRAWSGAPYALDPTLSMARTVARGNAAWRLEGSTSTQGSIILWALRVSTLPLRWAAALPDGLLLRTAAHWCGWCGSLFISCHSDRWFFSCAVFGEISIFALQILSKATVSSNTIIIRVIACEKTRKILRISLKSRDFSRAMAHPNFKVGE